MKRLGDKKYLEIVSHYEACLEKHGDTHLGVDWPKEQDVDTRYQVMLDVIDPIPTRPVRLLDFGCGAAHLHEYLLQNGIPNIIYSGLDLSEKFVALSRSKFPGSDFYHLDILEDGDQLPSFDYVVMNGVFTEKRSLSRPEMMSYFETVLRRVFEKTRIGLAFNLMSTQVDWERDDLFHVPLDVVASLLTAKLSRHFRIRHDYGLYEYTTYVYRHPLRTCI